MTFNFYTLVKYFWVIVFVVCSVGYMVTWHIHDLLRIGFCILMIIVFSVVDSMANDKKVLTK